MHNIYIVIITAPFSGIVTKQKCDSWTYIGESGMPLREEDETPRLMGVLEVAEQCS